MGFSEFLFNLLKECRQLSKLNLVRVSLDRLESRSFFDSLTQHPEIEKGCCFFFLFQINNGICFFSDLSPSKRQKLKG